MAEARKGRLFVVSGPSGVGKGTVVAEVLRRLPHLRRVITYTTRPPRPGEVPDRDYHFVSREEFERLKEQGAFLEWAEVYGNFYGSPKQEVDRLLAKGYDAVLVVDVQGALAIKRQRPEAVLIFLQPPSVDELRRRLEARGSDPPEVIEGRLAKAEWEMQQAHQFDYTVLNDELERAVQTLVQLMQRFESR
ncbi:MAG: hypothetical protein IMHGJWDQ_002018 [Candidatus Fervidibacter sp.]